MYSFIMCDNTVLKIKSNLSEISELIIPSNYNDNEINIVGSKMLSSPIVENKIIKKIVFPSTLKEIGPYCFSNCGIEEIDLSSCENLEIIHKHAFENNQIKSLILPKNLKYLGRYAFNMNNITNITFNKELRKIGECCFQYNFITKLDLSPTKIKEIPTAAFSANAIENIKMPQFLVSIGCCSFSSNFIKEIELGCFLDNIGRMAFYNNELTSIDIPVNINEIGDNAFALNKNLLEIKIHRPVNYGYKTNWNGSGRLIYTPTSFIAI